MRPPAFDPIPLDHDPRFFRDRAQGGVWHRVFHRPLYADTDRSQVVYHANYLRYFEFGRASLMRDVAYPYKEVEANGYVYPIVDLAVRYVKPLYYDDPMWIYTQPGERTRVSVRFDYCICHAETGDILCLGHTRHCALNASGRVTPIDAKTVHLWETFPR